MLKIILQIITLLGIPFLLLAQNSTKKSLGHHELVTWKSIKNPQISNDGQWVTYELKGEEGDGLLKIYDPETDLATAIQSGERAKITQDSRFVIFKIKPPIDTVKALRRKKVKKEDLPKDELGIYTFKNKQTDRIPGVKSFKIPDKWSGFVVYHKEAEVQEITIQLKKDTTKQIETPKQKPTKTKKESTKDGTKLVVRNLVTGTETTFPFVINYELAEKGQKLLFQTTGNDSTFANGIYLYQFDNQPAIPLFRGNGDFKRLSMDDMGTQVAFLANLDTTNAEIEPFKLMYWKIGTDSAQVIANNSADFLPNQWIISEHKTPKFSEDGHALFFGAAPKPILKDTSLLDDEVVEVEVWHWQDGKLYTEQKVRKKQEERRSYTMVWHTNNRRFVQLGALNLPEIITTRDLNSNTILGYNTKPYEKSASWDASPTGRDLYIIDAQSGFKKRLATGLQGRAVLSPRGHFAYAYLPKDSAWFAHEINANKTVQLTDNQINVFYDESNDRPMNPRSYGMAGWIENDQFMLIYDRYDLWKIDPKGMIPPKNLTKGRAKKLRSRYIRLDREETFIPANGRLLLHIFDETTKESGYSYLDLSTGAINNLVIGPYEYTRRPIKAKEAEKIIFTKGNFETFPDLYYTDATFNNAKQISIANPQQKEYAWGTMELYEWTSFDGQKLQGLLMKPENFDPTKKYPMIVNFYERSSDQLFRHKPPSAGRSTINYPFYASKGYIIFNPDIPYEVGYPGKSCYNSVVSGTEALIKTGFIDEKNIGVQGHSWGGYQIAHLLTKTNLFKCAESGAPVVNMFSAYGGIRWGSGMSRMFQYEQTQSRIGGTIWEYHDRYRENSPIFEMDKTNTPVLIMHNDEDTAVPWYQGIEYFVALRRLGKPAWLLNYNGEPHWPVKLQNRKDFNIRMQQYFDHYLKAAPMPMWMKQGVSAVEKGKRQGLELIKE